MRTEPAGGPALTARQQAGLPASAYWLAVLPPLFWSGNFLIARLMRDAIPPVQMSFCRWSLALLILAPFCWRPIADSWPRIRGNMPFLALLGAIGVTAFNCFVYAALHYTSIANAALVNSLLPVVTFLLAYLILRETLKPRQLAGIALSLCGAVLVIGRGDPTRLAGLALNGGDLLVFAGMSCWALYTVLIRWRPAGLPPIALLGVTVCFGVLFHLPGVGWEYSTQGGFAPTAAIAGALLYFAIFPSVLAYIFWNRSVATLGPGKTGMFMHLLPPSSALLGFVVLGETITWFHLAGFAIITVGIWLVTAAPRGTGS
ncbi:drug/metabolite transporter (DMT)-like permease [Bosea sp. OAE752]|jgi:drug/metabolite transporter (DMT)-like permease|uniref:DMT family transporter n=1 Tax=unclassified Bosea (in: a-proteobacteria) TaxID=2653178 RepID=UPI00116E45E5